jgi:spermidine synthase
MLRAGLWLTTAFIAGAVVMTLEMVAFRLYAPYFGYSIYVWGTMISFVMLAMAAGYALGGRLADRRETDGSLYGLVLFAGVYQLVLLFAAYPLLGALSGLGDFAGPALATVVIFGPSVIALSAVGPYLIRLLARAGHVGMTAGRVYALSTVGSVGGILLASFVAVPRLGSLATLQIACGATVVLSVVGLVRHRRASAMALLLLAGVALAPAPPWSEGALWAKESPYNLVRVFRKHGALLLTLNEEHGLQSMALPVGDGWTNWYWDDLALGPLLVPADRALVLGMGGGSSIKALRQADPNLAIDAVEIDPEVIHAAVTFFALDPDPERLRIHLADARSWLMETDTDTRYDVVQFDLYQGGAYIPFYLMTVEFFRLLRSRMSDRAVLIMNLFDPGSDRELLSATAATLGEVFPSLAVYSRGNVNHTILATTESLSLDDIRQRLRAPNAPRATARLAQRVANGLRRLTPARDAPVFTDDLAPIEPITRKMVGEYEARRDQVEQ